MLRNFTSKVAIAVLLAATLSGCGKPSQEDKLKKAAKTCSDEILSYQYAKDFIKNQLKSPSSAKFPSFSQINHTYKGNCTHQLSGTFEAQNSFGVMIKNSFDVTVRYNKKNATYYLDKSVIQ
ncbi:hypothetical protein [Vibrio metschnikovii]|uniref:hypothetical protein n=1 Tax=Vibrio metschnikovii TaxID=28172 RepID=UPI002984A79D|nr:hypothetical protein [Vibrio metschnikovii]EKO3608453.1 hypothetical protein [Vibrio metschnikovii]EKO3622026.1 hypothetical protein [Vibrio metschnikovii]EKO3625137.1 hypothetical protein [Vibrio metschnikovii]EKO3663164.1 hypothetical protein [Vibrio metschnikovii]